MDSRYYGGDRQKGRGKGKTIHDTMAVIARGGANVSESRNLDEYVAVGLSDFENADGVPITLKSLLFNRYAQGNMSSLADCVEPFKKFYKQYYG
jgi:hypothetical protein